MIFKIEHPDIPMEYYSTSITIPKEVVREYVNKYRQEFTEKGICLNKFTAEEHTVQWGQINWNFEIPANVIEHVWGEFNAPIAQNPPPGNF